MNNVFAINKLLTLTHVILMFVAMMAVIMPVAVAMISMMGQAAIMAVVPRRNGRSMVNR